MSSRLAFAAVAVAAALACASAPPAAAQEGMDPAPEQFGSLTISVPAAATVGAAGPGGSTANRLGNVRVSDTRGLLGTDWTASVSVTAFTTGGGTAAETIPNSAVTYWSGPAVSTSGIGIFVPGQATAASAVPLNVQRAAFSRTGLSVGSSSATWNPTVRVFVPGSALSGAYTGRITHTVV